MIYCQTGYTRYTPCIYYTYTMQWSLATLLSCPPALGSLWLRLPSDLLSFGHREAAKARLGQSKLPQPGVDLINMAAPPRVRASTICTAALLCRWSVGCCTYVNSWVRISVQKAWNWRNSAEEVLKPSYSESGNRWGLVYPVNSLWLHDSSNPQVKFLKGAQHTVEEQLVTHKPHAFWIK